LIVDAPIAADFAAERARVSGKVGDMLVSDCGFVWTAGFATGSVATATDGLRAALAAVRGCAFDGTTGFSAGSVATATDVLRAAPAAVRGCGFDGTTGFAAAGGVKETDAFVPSLAGANACMLKKLRSARIASATLPFGGFQPFVGITCSWGGLPESGWMLPSGIGESADAVGIRLESAAGAIGAACTGAAGTLELEATFGVGDAS
jgi:hypothetical protein